MYVDKTRIIHSLIQFQLGNYYFLSRPRRFGKSLLLSTIKEIFSGNKQLFSGLWIESQWNWQQKHPVIHLGLSSIGYASLGLYDALMEEMDNQAALFGLKLESKHLEGKFKELIRKVGAKQQVVILIDEYDKPIIDYLDDLPKAEENRTIFKNFYSVLKDADPYIRLLFITGVSRFSKVSIFSGLNNIEDISLSIPMNDIVGITQPELEINFTPEVDALAEKFGTGASDILEKIKDWYNGYSWRGDNTLYNPFSLLLLFKQQSFDNFLVRDWHSYLPCQVPSGSKGIPV